MTVTAAPRFNAVQAMDSPKIPAPQIVSSAMDKRPFPWQFRASDEVDPRVQEDHPILDWKGDVPVARAFDDPYFSLSDGLSETRHVFLRGNCLPERFRPELVAAISEEVNMLGGAFGASEVTITGLDQRTVTQPTGALSLDVYIPYTLTIVK